MSKDIRRLVQEGRTFRTTAADLLETQKQNLRQICGSLQTHGFGPESDLLFAHLSHQFVDIAHQEVEASNVIRVLKALTFDQINFRVDGIQEAHAKTFEWILQHPLIGPDGKIKNTFRPWLTSGDGIYYISGKAGSGKSTLMKFLSNHPLTKHLLSEWADKTLKKLIVASFFCWNAGTAMQKYFEGLVRSLMFEIMRHCPHLVAKVFPDPWRGCDWGGILRLNYTDVIDAFDRMFSEDTPFSGYCFCFFIDGLDEYAGDHRQMAKLLRVWAKSPHIKICVSSRPWTVFEDAFSAEQKLHLQDLTQPDIEKYVQDQLGSNRILLQMPIDMKEFEDLVSKIVAKAEGLFLWVTLVVQSMLDGLGNDDRISDLKRKLEVLPAGLVPFFQHILNSVHPSYKPLTARMFMVAQMAPKPLPALIFSLLDDIEESPELAYEVRLACLHRADIDKRVAVTRRLLDGRCKGLLEVRKDPIGDENLSYQVYFLHRTVRDFVEMDDIRMELRSQVGLFDAEGTLAEASLALFQMIPIKNEYFTKCGPLYDLMDDACFWAARKELKTGFSQIRIIQRLDKTIREYKQRQFFKPGNMIGGIKISPGRLQWKENGELSLVQFAAAKGISSYVYHKIEGLKWSEIEKDERTNNPLDCVVLGGGFKSQYSRALNVSLAWHLLGLGASPNAKSVSRPGTVWKNYAEMFYQSIYPGNITFDDWRMIEIFLRYRADPNVEVRAEITTLRTAGTLGGDLSPTAHELRQSFGLDISGRFLRDFDDPYFREWRSISLKEFVDICSPSNAPEINALILRKSTVRPIQALAVGLMSFISGIV
jgi:hypothetical protein